MFHFSKKKMKSLSSELYDPLDEFPSLIKNLIKPFSSFSGFFSTEGVRKYLIDHILEVDTFEEFAPDLFIVGTQL